jgi:tetratricopeptide (TPR) repeat protein
MSSASQSGGDEGKSLPCPGCGKTIPQAWLVCLHCGFDQRTGAKRETHVHQAAPPPTLQEPEEVRKAVSPSAADAEEGDNGKGSGPPAAQTREREGLHGKRRRTRPRRRSRRFRRWNLSVREIVLLAIFGALSFWLYCVLYGTPSWLSGRSGAPEGAEYYNRGRQHHLRGDLDDAIREYTKAIEVNPRLALAYNNRGVAYKDKGDLDAAMRDFNQAISVDPKLTDAYANRGALLISRGEIDAAIQDCTKAIELDPAFALGYRNRGAAYFKKGDFDAAMRDRARALELEANRP